MSQARQCAARIAVIRRDGERGFVDQFVTTSFGAARHSYSIYRFGRDRCSVRADGSFLIVRTGERLRRTDAPARSAFAR